MTTRRHVPLHCARLLRALTKGAAHRGRRRKDHMHPSAGLNRHRASTYCAAAIRRRKATHARKMA